MLWSEFVGPADLEGGGSNAGDDVTWFPFLVEFDVGLNVPAHVPEEDGLPRLVHGKLDVHVCASTSFHCLLLLLSDGICDSSCRELPLQVFCDEVLGVPVARYRGEYILELLPQRDLGAVPVKGIVW